jgi:mycothiol synthase
VRTASWNVHVDEDVLGSFGPLEGFAELEAECRAHDSHAPFDDHSLLTLQGQRDLAHARFSISVGGSLMACALLAEGVDAWSLEVAVVPAGRGRGMATDLVLAAESHVASHGGGTLRSWVHASTPALARLCQGWRVERTLLILRRCLTARLPDAVGPTRPLGPGDAESWLALSNAAFDGHPENGNWELRELAWRMEQPWTDLSRWPVVVQDGQLVAGVWTKVQPGSASGELYVVAVHPLAQGRGLGKVVVARALRDLRDSGCTSAFLYVDAANGPAIALYRAAGFTDGEIHRCFERAVPGA